MARIAKELLGRGIAHHTARIFLAEKVLAGTSAMNGDGWDWGITNSHVICKEELAIYRQPLYNFLQAVQPTIDFFCRHLVFGFDVGGKVLGQLMHRLLFAQQQVRGGGEAQ